MSNDSAVGDGGAGSAPSMAQASTPIVDGAPRSWWTTPLSGGALFCLLLTLVLSVAAAWFFYSITQQQIARDTALKSRGVETTGTVAGFYTTTSGGRHSTTTLHVRYTYDVPNGTEVGGATEYQASSSIADSQYAPLANDHTLPVIYDPQDPTVVQSNFGDWIRSWTPAQSMKGFFFVIGVTLPILWLLVGSLYLRVTRATTKRA
jgi:hypothetical protein